MIDKALLKAGHIPTLLGAFFYCDLSFVVWVMLGPLGLQLGEQALESGPCLCRVGNRIAP
jgi:nitrate/nitrite transporter NarK